MGVRGQRLKLAVYTHSAAVQMRMVAAGVDLGLIPQKLRLNTPHADALSIVTLNDFQLKMAVWMAHSR